MARSGVLASGLTGSLDGGVSHNDSEGAKRAQDPERDRSVPAVRQRSNLGCIGIATVIA
jgi:riboflavin biosynthesis pyrimidine reductase